MKNRPFWATQYTTVYYSEIEKAFEQSPTKHFFHFEALNITNGTSDLFDIRWDVYISRECFANNTDPKLDNGELTWTNDHNGIEMRYIEFSTAPGAQLPDIEAIVDSCPERDEDNTAAVRVTQVRTTYNDYQPCPVLNTTVKPDRCAFKSAAKELAANVSTAMLTRLGCDEGDWRTIAVPCLPRAKSMALPQSAGSGVVGWALLALAIAVSNFGVDTKMTRNWRQTDAKMLLRLTHPTHPAHPSPHPSGGKGPRFHAMPIGRIETISQRIRKLVYGRADGMPNSLESMVVCELFSSMVEHKK